MKKTLLSLVAILGCAIGASAQVNLKLENNTQQYFTGTLLDNTWMGTTPPMYMDIPNNQASVRFNPPIQTGGPLTSTAAWRGIQLRAYPSGIYYSPVYFTSTPFAASPTPFGPGIPVNVFCDVISPTDILVRINP